ncbi:MULTISPECIES: alpha/beta fold hydrolase [unclassified Mycolicibacterium]|uniref:alpha/beta fold hydrolase n=1 Tax=unclassified Mycolicibacterium TaxID=2636767 RepID=UPI0012DE278F|nr:MULTISPECIES: alpha/beta fold hydrolase [unclassified Mycolicibacterium]MUL83376.1 lysophospholipase [Mycolicibacterium sp. CBMA 329]MUL90367.1 lysophospholipase [Mycolicibacterium sp. CBMA 331]MUM00341.1 lysophospholipase [Mycolicibacterium sp. CBMA 334]MUM27628.1 lysophospholipase [Mycolicibacterium sp. CBMA 295]MUM41311.1 lysophospholipase [Mycolicibacterium sp. CBMA 247]
MTPTTSKTDPHPRVVMVDGVPMSALVAESPDPRAVVVALHGGATTSAYFDCPGHPELSLLRTAVAQGYSVIALDRPGYGASAAYPDAMARPEQRAALAFGAIERIAGAADLFLLGHSMGCELALHLAVQRPEVLGLSLAGTGRRYHPGAQQLLKDASPLHRPRGLRELLWEPARLYPSDMIGAGLSAGGAAYEGDVVKTWSRQDFPALAGQTRIPVQFLAGEFENVWESDPEALTAIAGMFTASPRVLTGELSDSGHNLSVGLTAGTYHRKVLSFADECVADSARGAVNTEVEVEAG